MNKTLLLTLGLLSGSAMAADTGSPALKAESQNVIQRAGHPCSVVNGVYPAAFGGSVTVMCDDKYRYVIKNKGGNLTVETGD